MSDVDEKIRNVVSQTALGDDAKKSLTDAVVANVMKNMLEKSTVAVARASLQAAMEAIHAVRLINKTDRDVGLGIVDDLLKTCGFRMEEESLKTVGVSLGLDVAKEAFNAEYENHGGEEAFWLHVKTQQNAYNESRGTRYPFFSILQSSGYGKSRLVFHLMEKHCGGFPRIVYLSLADESEFRLKREAAQAAFCNLFYNAIRLSRAGTQELALGDAVVGGGDGKEDSEEILFIVDEVSQLMKLNTLEGVNFYQGFCHATKEFEEIRGNCFFVVLSTFSSASDIVPSRAMDPSRKNVATSYGNLEPMETFLLHQSLGLRKEVSLPIDECLKPMHMFSLGRPMWGAYLKASMKKGMRDEVVYATILRFAVEKLLLSTESLEARKLSREQMLALLACRVCLTISPVSRYASFLIGSHMATAVHISSDREAIVAEYPSEPILALASRFYVQKGVGASQLLTMLNEYFANGAVPKGHRGEVIVRLLNLFAMDKCMSEAGAKPYEVREVSLKTFLDKFDREQAPIPDLFSASEDSEMGSSTAPKKRTLNEVDGANIIPQKPQPCFPSDATVCFTHFVYVARTKAKAIITPELLRQAYKRSAAIVVEEGRRGIDWIIPLHLKDDKFIGLVGRDKNRKSDVLDSLTATGKEETGPKLSAVYFLTETERQLFEEQGSGLYWPTVFFAVGASGVGAARASEDSLSTRSGGGYATSKFPTLVLTGLDYGRIMEDEAAEGALKKLRDSYFEPPEVYQQCVPLTYGASHAEFEELMEVDHVEEE